MLYRVWHFITIIMIIIIIVVVINERKDSSFDFLSVGIAILGAQNQKKEKKKVGFLL